MSRVLFPAAFAAVLLIITSAVCMADTSLVKNKIRVSDTVPQEKISDRELLEKVLYKLKELETRLESESGPAAAGHPFPSPGDTSLANPRSGNIVVPAVFERPGVRGKGKPPFAGKPDPDSPKGVPHQLEILRAQVALLNEKINDLMVSIGLPPPPDMDADEEKLFKLSTRACLRITMGVEASTEGLFKTRGMGKGGLGINFYGNKLTVALNGEGGITGKLEAKPLKGEALYMACFNRDRAEYDSIREAMPISYETFESDFGFFNNELRSIRENPFLIINPQYKVFGLPDGGFPSPDDMVTKVQDFFDDGIKAKLCNELKSQFSPLTLELEEGIADKFLGNAVKRFHEGGYVGKLQGNFNDDCR